MCSVTLRTVFVGLDYHASSVQVCVMDSDQRVLLNRSCANTWQAVMGAVQPQCGEVSVQAAIESCCGAANLADELIGRGWSVHLAHAGYVSRMKQSRDKTDFSDARMLADLQRVGYLPRVWLAPEEVRELRRLVHYTGSDWRHVQPWILLTNYHRYVDQFIRYGIDLLHEDSRYVRMVLPGNVMVERGMDEGEMQAIVDSVIWHRYQMPAYHLIAANGHLLVLTERGTLVLSRANPGRYTELAHASVLRGTCWTHPVLANGLVYCRSHEGELVCLDLRWG